MIAEMIAEMTNREWQSAAKGTFGFERHQAALLAHGQTFAPGSYDLVQIGGHLVRLQHAATRKGVTLMSTENVGDGHASRLCSAATGRSTSSPP